MKERRLAIYAILGVVAIVGALQTHNVDAQETLFWAADVFADGSLATSPALELGRTYRVATSEVFWYNYTADLVADAYYYTKAPYPWNWIDHYPAPDGHSFLQIDDADVNWGPYNATNKFHNFSIYYVGQGMPITFTIVDWIDGNYSNNRCHLPVKIYVLPTPQLAVAITPLSATIYPSDPVFFNSTATGGTSPYAYQWYKDNNPVSGATSSTWTFIPTAPGTYYVYLKVTDALNNTVQSATAKIIVLPMPVGGQSVSLAKSTWPLMLCYATLMAMFIVTISLIRNRKT